MAGAASCNTRTEYPLELGTNNRGRSHRLRGHRLNARMAGAVVEANDREVRHPRRDQMCHKGV